MGQLQIINNIYNFTGSSTRDIMHIRPTHFVNRSDNVSVKESWIGNLSKDFSFSFHTLVYLISKMTPQNIFLLFSLEQKCLNNLCMFRVSTKPFHIMVSPKFVTSIVSAVYSLLRVLGVTTQKMYHHTDVFYETW